MAYYPQIDGSSEYMNQTVEIALHFFIYAIDDPFCWPKVLPRIQSLLNNTFSSTTGKISYEITYGSCPRRPLDLFLAILLPNTYVTYAEAFDAISFVLADQKKHYNRCH